MYFFLFDIFLSSILFFYSFLMIIFQIFHYSICSLYFIVGDIPELHLLFISSPRTIYFRWTIFWAKILFFDFLSLSYAMFRFSAILKNLRIFKKPNSKESMFLYCSRNWKWYFSPPTSHSFLRGFQSIDFPSDIILYFVTLTGSKLEAKIFKIKFSLEHLRMTTYVVNILILRCCPKLSSFRSCLRLAIFTVFN